MRGRQGWQCFEGAGTDGGTQRALAAGQPQEWQGHGRLLVPCSTLLLLPWGHSPPTSSLTYMPPKPAGPGQPNNALRPACTAEEGASSRHGT